MRRRKTNRTIPDHVTRRIDEARLDDYTVLAQIARGGTSTVFLGEHLLTRERVAIKALHPSQVEHSDMVHRLLNEHSLAQRARHPGLLEIRTADLTPQGIPYLVMEHVDGESLGMLADRLGVLPRGVVLAVARQISSAVAALHAGGVVHCDLKPDNVLVVCDSGLRIKVIDFGVARLADDPPVLDGAIVGTPAFMPPEQWQGAPTAASDVYALGCVLYELVTGEPVFSGALPQLLGAHCHRAPAPPSLIVCDLEPALDHLILRMLGKDPAQRPSMVEVASELAPLVPAEVAVPTSHPLGDATRSPLVSPPRPRRERFTGPERFADLQRVGPAAG